jgi:hypothetical protein
MGKFIKYRTQTQVYTEPKTIISDCNSITFINSGTTDNCLIDGLLLFPAQSFTVEGNFGEINVTTYSISFITQVAPSVTVIRKVYTN